MFPFTHLLEEIRICHLEICHFGHKDYFELKAIKKQEVQEKLSSLPLSA